MAEEWAYGVGGFALGSLVGGVAGYTLKPGAAPVAPMFANVVSRYRVEVTWVGTTFNLTPEFIAQTTTGDELWAWLEPGRGIWAISKLWEKPEGVSFEIARLCWAPLKVYREGTLVAEFPEVLMAEVSAIGHWSTTELP